MKNKPKVYVAGKLNDTAVDYIFNIHKMMSVAEELRLVGCSVYIPAIDFLMGIKFGYKDYKDYFDNSQPWLEVSDVVALVPGWQDSKGTALEIKTAQNRGIPVYRDYKQLIRILNSKENVDN